MKKRILSVLLCLALAITLLPAAALAESPTPTRSATLYYKDGKMYSDAEFTSEITDVPGWSGSGSTLTLSGLSFTTTADIALWLNAGTTVVLAEGTDNWVRSGDDSASGSISRGIYANGDVTITGSGRLTAAGGTEALNATASLTVKGKLVTPVGGTVAQDNDNYYTVMESDGATPAKAVVVKSVPPTPASSGSDSSVTVPASSGAGSVKVNAQVSGGVASVSVTDAQIKALISSPGSTGMVTVDVSSLKTDSAKLPASLTEAASTGSQGLRAILSSGSVTLDNTALRSAGKGDLTVSAEIVKPSELSAQQKKILGGKADSAVIVDVNVLVNGVKISDFGGGIITVSVPYAPKAGEDTSKLVVWFLRDNGTLEPHAATYDARTGMLTFTTTHLSRYVVAGFPFSDVADGSYCYTSVVWAVNNGVTDGKTDTAFAPDDTCTRAQAVTFLRRAMGSPEPTAAACPFTDVSADAYYYKAVLWAVEKGIAKGTSDTTFSPDAAVTRAQAVTFQHRAAGSPTVNFAMIFTDVSEGLYYTEAVRWAASEQITDGTASASFSPARHCTRAQIVTFLWRQSVR